MHESRLARTSSSTSHWNSRLVASDRIQSTCSIPAESLPALRGIGLVEHAREWDWHIVPLENQSLAREDWLLVLVHEQPIETGTEKGWPR